MKKTLLLLLLLVAGATHAQIVNIPDANFKNFLLQWSGLDANGDGNIQITEAQAIDYISITENPDFPITSLEGIEYFSNINFLSITVSQVSSINASQLSNLLTLVIDDNALVNLNIDGLTNLEVINLNSSGIVSLDLSSMLNLDSIILNIGNNNQSGSLIIGNNTNLEYISLGATGIPYIDLGGCPNIQSFSFGFEGSHDVFLNLKNGNINYTQPIFGASAFFLNDEGYTCYICIDENEEFVNVSNNVVFTTNCTATFGEDYNTITGTVTFDGDANGCTTTDAAMNLTKVEISDGVETRYSLSNGGTYNFYTQAGTFTLTPQFENGWFTATPATVTFADNNNNVTTQNFCVAANGVHPDVEVVIVPLNVARPGFDAVYKIVYTNKGNQTLSGNVAFTYDDTVLDYVSAIPAEDASATGSLTWSYSSLVPFESSEVIVTLNVNSPMETPAVNIDDALDFSVTVTPTAGDETAWDNTFGLKQIVVGSYDPNDITCLEGTSISPNYIGQYLHYNINFENTGTYPATFVVVKDVIDEAQFDVSTLQLIDASHDVEARVTGNKVEFYFNDINLAANGGKGNVAFKIKTLNILEVNDDVTQQAEIFFDYNLPIETNDATTVFSVLSNPGFDKDTTIKVYPNPAGNTVTISAQSELKHVALYDVQGRLLQAVTANGTQASLDLSGRAGGAYFIKTVTEKGAGVEKVMKM